MSDDERLQKTAIAQDDWTVGPPEAPITLLEYGDFECPHCAAARPVLEGLVADDPGAIRLAYRHFPIASLHPHAAMAAEAAEAAGAQGLFWPMHDMIFTHHRALGAQDLRAYAGQVGVDLPRYDAEMQAHAHFAEVRRDFRRGVEDGVNGTPTIFINGRRYDGPRDRPSMRAAIAALSPR